MKPDRPAFAEALNIIGRHSPLLGTEIVATHAAFGRCLAEAVAAIRDYPAADLSAMDGFAIPETAIAGTFARQLIIGAPQYAGGLATTIETGEARSIATGALIPAGTGAVLVRERAVIDGAYLQLSEALPSGMNIRRAGEDACEGEPVVETGRVLHAAMIGALCSYGVSQVVVRRRPAVALLISGDELKSVELITGSDIVDANGPMIAALLRRAGCDVHLCPVVADSLMDLVAILRGQVDGPADMIVSTGGVSAGDRDLLPTALGSIGAALHFHGVAMRPGKPVLFASLRDGRPVLALPGNPVAAIVGARFLVMRAIRAMMGLNAESALGTSTSVEPGVTRVLSAKRGADLSNPLGALVVPGQQSHRLRPLLVADSWIVSGGSRPSFLYPLTDPLELP